MLDDDDSSTLIGSLFASSALVFFGLVVNLGLGFLVRLITGRWLGTAGYGALALGYMMVTTVAVFVLVGMDTGVGRYLPRFDATTQQRGVLKSAVQVVLPLAVLSGATLALGAEFIAEAAFDDPSLAPVFRAFALAIPLVAIIRLSVGGFRGLKNAGARVLVDNVSLPTSRLTFVVLVLIGGLEVTGAAWAYVASYAVVAALAVYILWQQLPPGKSNEAVGIHRQLLTFSVPLMITDGIYLLFGNADSFLIGYYLSASSVGVYNAAYPLARLLIVVLNAFGFLLMPVISELHSEDRTGTMRRTYAFVGKWVFIVTLPGLFFLFTYPSTVLNMTFGPEYAGGALSLTILAVGFFAHAIAGPSGNALAAIGKTRSMMYDNATVLAINLGLNVVLVPRWGIVGAAVATTVGYGVLNGLYLGQLYLATGMQPFTAATVKVGGAGAIFWTGIAYGGAQLGVADVLRSGLVFGAFCALYSIVILRFGNIGERELSVLKTVETRTGLQLGILRSLAKQFIR